MSGSHRAPEVVRVRGEVSDAPAIFIAPEARDRTGIKLPRSQRPSTASDKVLRKVSSARKSEGQPYEVAADSLQKGLALVAAMYRKAGNPQTAPGAR